MKNILKQFFIVLFFFGLIYSVVFVRMLASETPTARNILDTGSGSRDYSSEQQQVVLNRDPLNNPNPKIIFIGSSNTIRGFRPQQFLPYFPGYEIHNMAVSASNLNQTKKIIELAFEVMPKSAQNKTIFVLGLDYMLLVENKILWSNSLMDIENEQLRFGLYQQKDGSIQPQVPQKYFSYYVKFLRPFFYLNSIFTTIDGKIKYYFEAISRVVLKSKNPVFAPTNVENPLIDESYKKWAINKWHDYMGRDDDTVSEEQFMVLLDIAKLVREHGSRLVIVDMPLPVWHTDVSKHFQDYQLIKKKILKMATALGNVFYINMQDLNTQEDFSDSAHPTVKTSYQWSKRLSQELIKTVIP